LPPGFDCLRLPWHRLQSPRQAHGKPAARTSIERSNYGRCFSGRVCRGTFFSSFLPLGRFPFFTGLAAGFMIFVLQKFCVAYFAGIYCNHGAKPSRSPVRRWLLQTQHLQPLSRRRAPRCPALALIFSTKCLFIQQKTASRAPPARSDRRLKGRRLLCQPISAPRIAISDHFGRRFRPLLALVASRPSNSAHPPRKSRGNQLEPRVRHEKVLPCVEIFNAWCRIHVEPRGSIATRMEAL